MADSNITKKALATALRELMGEVPFEKIQVAHICERCDMNRKSFYYHFKDKYDLVNWIFDTEFIAIAKSTTSDPNVRWKIIEVACNYLYENRAFYRKALKIKGQNSFSEHLREYCLPIFQSRISVLLGDESVDDFAVNFFADGMLCAIERWLLDKDCMPPEQFVTRLKHLVQRSAVRIYQEMEYSE